MADRVLVADDREKAVAICEDVLVRLPKRRVERGAYFDGVARLPLATDPASDLQSVMADVEGCAACAGGNLLLSLARLYDNVPVSSVLDLHKHEDGQPKFWAFRHSITLGRALTEKLQPVFGRELLVAIEVLFEGFAQCLGAGDRYLSRNPGLQRLLVADFDKVGGLKVPAVEALRGICERIVAGNGSLTLTAVEGT